MKNIIVTAILLAGLAVNANAQKKPLDHNVYDSWQSVQSVKISNDGKIVSWQVNPQEGDCKLYIRNLDTGSEMVLDRASKIIIPEDGKYAVCTIAPHFSETRQAKIDKKKKDDLPKDTVAVIDLGKFSVQKFENASKAGLGYQSAPYIFISQDNKAKSGSKNLLVLDTANGQLDTLKNIYDFAVSKSGNKLAAVVKKDEKDSLSKSSITLYDFSARDTILLSEGKKDYTAMQFNDADDKFLFEATDDEEKLDGTPRYSIFLTSEIVTKKANRKTPAVREFRTEEIVSQDYSGLPQDWIIAKDSRPRFSNSSKRMVLTLSKYYPARDSTIYDFEAAQLDVWRWDSPILPPMSKSAAAANYREKLYAVINLDQASELLTISATPYEDVSFPDGADADLALLLDSKEYCISTMWASEDKNDVYLVDLRDGSRKLIKKALTGTVQISPKGKYLLWFNPEDASLYSYCVKDGSVANMTAAAGSVFYDEEDDHPLGYMPYAYPKWVGDDDYVLFPDKFDIWKLSPDGKNPENLTAGHGRSESVQFRYTDIELRNNPHLFSNTKGIDPKSKVYFTTFNEINKENGYATMTINKASSLKSFTDTCTFTGTVKAKNSETIAYLKGNFRNPADLYISKDAWVGQTRLSAINPQQADYVWGNVRLVSWNAYDGTALKGLLYTPDNLDETKQYPMMIYFYEKNSETLYKYISPAPSRSIINIPFYVSRGYVVFVPDIVYTVGHPGESAYNCICAGAEAMCKQFGFIDKTKMAIQGQSWGGYQTAYLVTRTNMFAAAGAGAPVSNMTSAYGGIRWESGNSRIGQYEHGQSRIGKTLWEPGGFDLYVENSPVFFAPKVKTPVLIMHNDADGAVPWYQGIEFFMSLRRLDKPVWLLEYNNEAHNLLERRNCKDLSIRLQQFFDHYLKDEAMPEWMKNGIPHARKGNYFGYEPASGLD